MLLFPSDTVEWFQLYLGIVYACLYTSSVIAVIYFNTATVIKLISTKASMVKVSGEKDRSAERKLTINTIFVAAVMLFMCATAIVYGITQAQVGGKFVFLRYLIHFQIISTAYFFVGDIFTLSNPIILLMTSNLVRAMIFNGFKKGTIGQSSGWTA